MNWYPTTFDTTATFTYCTHCKAYVAAPHDCQNDQTKEIILRLQRVENYLLELLSKARSSPSISPSDSSS